MEQATPPPTPPPPALLKPWDLARGLGDFCQVFLTMVS